MDDRQNRPAPEWLEAGFHKAGIVLWGIAGLRGMDTPIDETGEGFPRAVAFAVPMDPLIMSQITGGPTDAYAAEYRKVNRLIDKVAVTIAEGCISRGYRALPLAASHRTNQKELKGDFPHKTAATRAGIGWIGRHAMLITKPFGPWVRLGTVFTDALSAEAQPSEKSYCGNCTRCIDACPAGALKMSEWTPGLPREAMLDVHACNNYKVKHFFAYNRGHNCGICAAVCPYGIRLLKKEKGNA